MAKTSPKASKGKRGREHQAGTPENRSPAVSPQSPLMGNETKVPKTQGAEKPSGGVTTSRTKPTQPFDKKKLIV